MVLEEEKVLQELPAAAASGDSDEWPIFGLRNVRIWNAATGRTCSLLEAHRTTPLVVDGMLENLGRDVRHLAKLNRQDGSLCFWAGGRAGWYEIKSSTSKYEEVYKGMEEALDMWYYLADAYAAGAAKKKTQKVLEEFVNSQQDSRRRDGEDALEGFAEHRRFIIKCMLEGHEGLDWAKTPVYRYFQKRYPEDFTAIQRLVAANEETADKDSEAMDIKQESHTPKKSGKKKVKPSSKDITTPKQRKKRDPELSGNSDDSMEDGDASLLQTQTRSVLRPRSGQKSSQKFVRRQRDNQTTAGTDADAEESEEAEPMEVDSPSRPPVLSDPEGTTSLLAIGETQVPEADTEPRAAFYEQIDASDVWTCPYDGCNQKIWDARSSKSRELMEEHFSVKHAGSMTELIMSERRPYNNVQHLLSRVKDMGVERRF